ncbi:esterase-like activity of phytase family protein [Microvirga sp. VF16]|uniref:esterase-like activity of phytase family protein n=1 Tax=Microvirga sp. VF16 TaxID=2807101 RepID=UPI00193CA029|nr:esterase-like activity of phytase family protein [Microvirga sp. VF16]QRM28206.1 esterase-like activity of phytase family protein [Microvirga sp. VF16]
MSVRLLAALPLTVLLCTSALAQQQFPAVLAGHAVLPALSFVDAPADAPADLKISGKFTTGKRVEALGAVEGTSGDRPTGVKLPFRGQPLQGHSGIKSVGDGTFWVITDNGFGSKATSPDSMLYLNRHRIDWNKGAVERLETVFLHDPDKKVPFRIANEATEKRYLTGSDFDIESFQPIGDKIWIAEEFGPYLIKADRSGKIEAIYETLIDGKPARSPDHYAVTTPAAPNATVNFNVRRSKGYEGMAASKDGKFLYALLEGPVWDAEKKQWENVDGREYLRILEFDVANEKWTGRHWKYGLDQNGLAIGDFNMIDGTTGLVIERDNGEGTADKACPQGVKRPDCFQDVAKFKRIVKIELSDANVNSAVRKIGYVDLMQIADPNKKAKKPLNDTMLTFPFFTIENVDVVDERHIVVGNDNNLPFSTSREPNKQDDNEFVLLDVTDLLKAQ